MYRYEVPPGVLQHLAATLQKLSRTGFSWQDDYTQRVVAQELAHLPRTYPRRPEAAHPARGPKKSVEDEMRYGLEGDGGRASALERYLEALSQATAPNVLPRMKQDRPPAQGEDPLAGSVLNYVAQTPALTYAPASRAGYPASGPLRTLGRLQPDELSPKVDGGVEKRNLVAALGAYLAMKPPETPQKGDPRPNKLQFPWMVPRDPSAPVAPRKWSPPPEDPEDPPDDEAPTSSLLTDLRKQPARVERLSPLDLDQVARVIADAVHGVGASGPWEGNAGEPAGSSDERPPEDGDQGRDGPQDGGARGDDGTVYGEVSPLSLKLGDLLQDPGPPLAESFKAESKKSEEPEAALSSEEEGAGVENVKSQTYSKDLLERPPHSQPWGDGLGESQRWAPGALQEDQPLEAGAQGQPGDGLRLEVKSPAEEAYGYIVTDNDPLSPEKGKALTADVARLLQVPLSVFADIEVLGPAVTFRVSPNTHNLTTAGVVKAAADNKDKLERSSGLKILQAGVGSELCRQRMAVRTSDRPEAPHVSRVNSVSSQVSDGPIPSPCARSSTSSWSEEPAPPNMDISTGHMVLAYMEDHLKNKNRLEKEWEALCAYQAEPNSSLVAQREENAPKNRCPAVLTYDHSRVLLKSENSHSKSDYINASPIMDRDPRSPAYIATQGPLPATVADFWQMVWESGCVVIVMLTPLSENGVRQCYHYWPDEGSNLYHVYEVNLVSEHIWCEDFLVRSFYLKNLQTNETRTVTQFHFLSWHDQGVPSSARSLLDFRRKVNKCYRGRSCPIIVHCSDGAGRSGTYVLIDMVLNKIAKGAKEIDIAATLEHLRDQRPGMVQTKEQFEFALTAVAEEVNAILQALPQ
ncbi:PREDICTED: receptor-type tyrosine-protein phosphatase N2 isoform X3 [Hipposideros armiger]|uniref:Receptor-type tyrosine-protein phosphatase N2 isoform X3 n=1 Tax=Hipposideros armiger TaxID=186990 RepID=A0A8B7SML4_HIPAR|nr:PREDICTED: receptor-type tyrosine-protein phosphatase N2 isoform X3 [Hipposideros armiger]